MGCHIMVSMILIIIISWVVWHHNCDDRLKILGVVCKSRFRILCKRSKKNLKMNFHGTLYFCTQTYHFNWRSLNAYPVKWLLNADWLMVVIPNFSSISLQFLTPHVWPCPNLCIWHQKLVLYVAFVQSFMQIHARNHDLQLLELIRLCLIRIDGYVATILLINVNMTIMFFDT